MAFLCIENNSSIPVSPVKTTVDFHELLGIIALHGIVEVVVLGEEAVHAAEHADHDHKTEDKDQAGYDDRSNADISTGFSFGAHSIGAAFTEQTENDRQRTEKYPDATARGKETEDPK